MLLPTLSIQTVYLRDAERNAAVKLGNLLYAHLTRPADDPLAFGAGIPVLSGVAAEHVNQSAAEIVVLIPVLGKTTFHTALESSLAQLTTWSDTFGEGHVLPVPTSEVWRNAETKMPVKQLLTTLYGGDDAERSTLDEIVLAVSRLLDSSADALQLFISHAKRDLDTTGDAAVRIHQHVVNNRTGSAFFDTTNLQTGRSLADQINESASRGVLIAVRGDAYSSRAWCQQELLTAKQHGLPTLTVEVLKEGEQRASPYGGNGPSIAWKDDPGAVVSRAMVEWLRAAHFIREAERIKAAAGLPESTLILSRAPELLDLAQGPLERGRAQLVLHPDPELSVQERQILRSAYPRLQLVTPTTAFRRLLSRDGRGAVAAPLEGLQVAMSLSDSPDLGGPEGYTANHFHDATVYIARSLISAGAAIAYGGDFRKQGFTLLLSELIAGYNQTALESADYLHSYLAAPIDIEETPDVPIRLHSLADSIDLGTEALLAETDKAAAPLYYSDMRRLMAAHTHARVVIGGNAEPHTETEPGYGGRYPGIIEEAWRTLEANKPLYVLGGLGGAAALVAELLKEGSEIPDRLQDETWQDRGAFREQAAVIDRDPWRKKLGLPERIEDLAQLVVELGKPHMKSDEASIAWNGLNITENHQLFDSRDPVILASLVLKGLLHVTRTRGQGKLEIELVHGSVTSASQLDAIALATFERVPLGGAGAALDQALGGRASHGQAEGKSLIPLAVPEVDADWLFLASLGPIANAINITESVEVAARSTVDAARRHGFQRLGIVTFGGSIADPDEAADAMLRGFGDLAGNGSLAWFETDRERFNTLRESLGSHGQVQLTTREIASTDHSQRGESHKESLILSVTLNGTRLTATAMPPAGTGVASLESHEVAENDLLEFSKGSGQSGRDTPYPDDLETRGRKLADLLLGPKAEDILARSGDARMTIIHDVASSRLPFEMLCTTSKHPATETGISRRLAVRGMPVDRLFAPPPRCGPLGVVLIVNPTRDLPGTVKEARAVRAILELQSKDRINLKVLGDPKAMDGSKSAGQAKIQDATREAVLDALQSYDVLHYCGHAFFNGPGEDESGLLLAGKEKLTLRDMRELSSVPRIVFFNACEAGRVRGSVTTEASAFAELILKSGVEAYLGTYWQVADAAAADFATGVYTRLADGKDLETAVKESRADLYNNNKADWANYVLYGDGRFRLTRQDSSPVS